MTDEEAGRVRDFVGYGRHPPDPKWPGGAHVAVNFVINYEEGGERSVPDGDPASEAALTEGSTATFSGRDLGAEAARARRLVRDDAAARLLDALDDGRGVPRQDRAQRNTTQRGAPGQRGSLSTFHAMMAGSSRYVAPVSGLSRVMMEYRCSLYQRRVAASE